MKRIFTALALSLASFAFAQIPTNGLVASYPFTGNSNDVSGNNYHLTPFNGPTPTTDRFGNPNCAYLMDGVDDYFTATVYGPMGKKSRSITFWAKTTANFNGSGYAVINYGAPTSSGARFELGLNNACNGLYMDLGNGYTTKAYNTIDNSWHMYTVVYDSTISTSQNAVSFFVDATLISSSPCSSYSLTQTINTQTGLTINVGRFYPGIPRYFNGSIDDIHVYNRPLTQTEITTIYNTSPCSGPPVAPSSISGNSTICSGSTYIYSVAPISTASSYSWSSPGGWSGTSSTNTIALASGSSSGVISVIALNPCGSSAPVSLTVTSNPTPSVNISAGVTTICKGNSATLIGGGASSYTWNSTIISGSIAVSPTTTTTYTLVGANSFGCVNYAMQTITVTNNPLPTISVNGSGASCAGASVSLAANGANTYTWQPGNLNGFFVNVSPTVSTTYTVTGTDGNGCINSSQYTQIVNTCAGVNEFSIGLTGVSIFPNPAKDGLTIQLPAETTGVIELYNVTGALIYSELIQSSSTVINMTNKSSGLYFIRLITSKGIASERIIKE